MFSALESSWDSSARRGWTTVASFTLQACGLSLLVAISLIWAEGPPRVNWLALSSPAAFHPVGDPEPMRGHHTNASVSRPDIRQIIAPSVIPQQIVAVNDEDSTPNAPDLTNIGNGSERDSSFDSVAHSIGDGVRVVIPPRPVAVKPLLVSHLAEANLLRRVQPEYPSIARQAGIHGAVELRAIISKTGTIENLVVVRGHPMLTRAARDAVLQWRYHPYLLNGEPIEVETDITVNFLLSNN